MGYGILSKIDNIGIVVLTNSHLLKGKPNANVTLSFINNIEIPYNLDSSNVPKKVTILAESIQKTDDPVGDIILLKLKWNHLSPDLKLRILHTADQFIICKISQECPNGYILNQFRKDFESALVPRTLLSDGILNLLESHFFTYNEDRKTFQKSHVEDRLQNIPTINEKIELIKPDTIIAAENSHVIAIPTYGREGYSGSPVFTNYKFSGLLTKVHLDGTPFVYAIPIEDIVKRIQYSLFDNKTYFNPKIHGYWNKNGSLVVEAGGVRITEKSAANINSAGGGEGANSGGEPGNSGGEGGNSGGEGGNSGGTRENTGILDEIDADKWNDRDLNLSENIGNSNIRLKNDSLSYSQNEFSVQLKDPFIERAYAPLTICGFGEYSCSQNDDGRLSIPYLIDINNNRMISATTALVSRLAIDHKLSLNSEENKFQIPNSQEAGPYINQLRTKWPQKPLFIRNYFKNKHGRWDSAQMFIPPRLMLEALRNNDEDKYSFFEHMELFSSRKENKRFNLNKAYVINRNEDQFSLFSSYTATEPFSFKKENRNEFFSFRFMDYKTKTYNEVILDRNGEVATINEYDLFNFKNIKKSVMLQRSSLPEQLNWRFSENTLGLPRSKYNIVYVFNRENLTELERIFIETPTTVFEVIYCQLGEQYCPI